MGSDLFRLLFLADATDSDFEFINLEVFKAKKPFDFLVRRCEMDDFVAVSTKGMMVRFVLVFVVRFVTVEMDFVNQFFFDKQIQVAINGS